jgi:hypothetical protein
MRTKPCAALERRRPEERPLRAGFALVPALIVTSLVAMMGFSLLMAQLHGARVVSQQGEEYELTSAVESVATLAAEELWSAYLAYQGGPAGDIETFREFLDQYGVDGVPDMGAGPPDLDDGLDFLDALAIPAGYDGDSMFGDVSVESVRLWRHDQGLNTTHLYISVVSRSEVGEAAVSKPLQRAAQLVYTVEPGP